MFVVKQVYDIFSPFFKSDGNGLLKNKGLQRTIILAAIAVSCVASAVSVVYLYEALTTLQALLIAPGADLTVVAWGVIGCLGPSGIFAGFNALTHVASVWLSKELYYALSEKYIRRWIDGKSYYGLKFTNQQGRKINAAEILSTDLKKISDTTVKLFSAFVSSFSSFLVGGHQLWALSSPVTMTLWSSTFVLHGYMFWLAFGYAMMYSGLVSYFDQDLGSHDAAFRKKHADFMADLYHVDTHSEEIALKKGGDKERDRLVQKLRDIDKVENTSLIAQAVLSFTQNVSGKTAYMFGLILSAPGAISGKFDIFKAFSVSQFFANIVQFFSWHKENTTDLASLNVSLQRIKTINSAMGSWEEIEQQAKLQVQSNSNEFGVKRLSVQTPDGSPIFHNVSFNLPKGKATVITGPSGIGKSTLFRCFSGLWPFAQGTVELPKDEKTKQSSKVHYIPQQSYFPYDASILEAVIYPRSASGVSQAEKERIITLMHAFKLRNEIIKDLDKTDDWSKKLSGGEQQKIALIGAILAKPDVIFIDEGTNALDQESKLIVEKYLKAELPDVSVAAIDHGVLPNNSYRKKTKKRQPSKNLFFDYQLKVSRDGDNDGETANATVFPINKNRGRNARVKLSHSM